MADVGDLQRQRRRPVHELQRLAEAVEMYGRAQRRMTLDQCTHSRFQLRQVERHAQVIAEDVVIDGGLGMVLAMEDHPRLQRAQRIRVNDILRHARAVVGRDEGKGLRRA